MIFYVGKLFFKDKIYLKIIVYNRIDIGDSYLYMSFFNLTIFSRRLTLAMSQYFHIVGQGQSVTLEDLQRCCPNINLDGIILSQDGQQYSRQQVNLTYA